MSPTRFRAAVIRALAVILAVLVTAVLWLLSASALWSKGTGTPFTPLAWSDATQWWLANWWVSLWLVLAAAVPTTALAIILFGLFQFWRLRYRGERRLKARQTMAKMPPAPSNGYSPLQIRSPPPKCNRTCAKTKSSSSRRRGSRCASAARSISDDPK